VKNVLGFEPYDERICKLRLKGKFHNLSIIFVHAPTDDESDEIKKQFFEDLRKVHDQIHRHDIVILLGDMNAKIGREDVYLPVSGIHTLHDISNKNGELICEYAVVNNMSAMSTKFQHKRIHKGTWIAPDGQTLNQTDHVIVNKNKSSMIQNVKTMRGLNCDSDHFLVEIIVKHKLLIQQLNKIQQIKWNRIHLQDINKHKQYRQQLHNGLEGKAESQNINMNG
jgi:endonuclease/exonuclease/phosphatase family metal-dependent hydrolase